MTGVGNRYWDKEEKMKSVMKLAVVAAMATFAMRTHAYTEEVDGIVWNYVLSAGEAYISGPSYSAAIPVNTVGAITVPSSLGGCPVTRLDNLAFMSCYGLTSVVIPDSVASIGDYVFAGCSGIRSVTIPQCVCSLQLKSVFVSAYQAITNVVILDGVTSIRDYMFMECRGLVCVTIPDSVERIGEQAFDGCDVALFDVTTIPGVKLVDGWAIGNTGDIAGHLDLTGVRGIGESAFNSSLGECSGLTSVTIPGSVMRIGDGAFTCCDGMTNVQIESGVTSIGEWAFCECTGLTSVTIPASVTNVEEGAFGYCYGLTNIIFKGDAPAASDSSFQDVASGCIAYVSPSSTGWGVAEGQAWHGLTLRFLDTVEDELVYEIVDFAIEEAMQGGVVVRRMIVGVIAKAGETPVRGDADKVMFEATSDLRDWDGAAKLTPTVEVLEGDGTAMRFRVTPGDGTAASAFLRIRR